MSPTWATNAGNRLEVGSCSSVATRCCTKGATPGVSPMSAPLAVHVGHPNTPSMPMSAYCSREGEGGFGRGQHAIAREDSIVHVNVIHAHYRASQTLVGEEERGRGEKLRRWGLQAGKDVGPRKRYTSPSGIETVRRPPAPLGVAAPRRCSRDPRRQTRPPRSRTRGSARQAQQRSSLETQVGARKEENASANKRRENACQHGKKKSRSRSGGGVEGGGHCSSEPARAHQ
jgi:hypothetical protein